MKPAEKATVIAFVKGSRLPRKQVLAQLGLPKSTYYGWRCRGAPGKRPSRPWNQLRPEEEEAILTLARASPELSPRELSLAALVWRDRCAG